jgi:multicomponent Na+:H+ antiporter subunit B
MKAGDSFILRAVAALLFFVVNVFAVYLFLRGHNLPGGGFIGGLGCALSFILLLLAFGVEFVERLLRVDPVRIAATGVGLALLSSLLPVFWGAPFLRQYNYKIKDIPFVGDLPLGTPLVFDLGVFLVVVGVTTKLIFVLARSITGLPALTPEERSRYAAPVESPIEDSGERREDGTEVRR